jgi:hypothetical protein
MAGAGAVTSTDDRPRPPMHSQTGRRLPTAYGREAATPLRRKLMSDLLHAINVTSGSLAMGFMRHTTIYLELYGAGVTRWRQA